MTTLDEKSLLQSLVRQLIGSGEPDNALLETLEIPGFKAASITEVKIIEPSDAKSKVSSLELKEELRKRLGYHRYGFKARTRLQMENTFPRTRNLLGEKQWNELGARYSMGIGSHIPDLQRMGARFAAFLRMKGLKRTVWDLARLEWTLKEVSALPDHTMEVPYTPPKISQNTIIQLRSTVRVIPSLYNDDLILNDPPATGCLLLFRAGKNVRVISTDFDALRLFREFREPTSISLIAEAGYSDEIVYRAFRLATQLQLFDYRSTA